MEHLSGEGTIIFDDGMSYEIKGTVIYDSPTAGLVGDWKGQFLLVERDYESAAIGSTMNSQSAAVSLGTQGEGYIFGKVIVEHEHSSGQPPVFHFVGADDYQKMDSAISEDDLRQLLN